MSKPSTPVMLIGGGLMLAGLTGIGGYALGEFLEPAHWYILGQHITSALIFDLGVFAGVLGLVMTAFNTLGAGGAAADAVPGTDQRRRWHHPGRADRIRHAGPDSAATSTDRTEEVSP